MSRVTRVALLVALGLPVGSLAGCLWTSAADGDALRRRTSDHEVRVTKLEQGLEHEREQLHGEVEQLHSVLQEATSVVTRNSADTGAQVQQMQEQLATLNGQIEELRNANDQLTRQLQQEHQATDERIAQLMKKQGVDQPLAADQIPADKDAHWQAAQQAIQGSDWARARALLREYVTRYAHDDRADDAQLAIGSSYLSENRPASALGELRRVVSDYPQGDALDDALLAMGDAFYRLHACTDARSTLETFVRTMPRSPLVSRARDKLREIQHAPRGYCTS